MFVLVTQHKNDPTSIYCWVDKHVYKKDMDIGTDSHTFQAKTVSGEIPNFHIFM